MSQQFNRADLNLKNWGPGQLARTQFWTKIKDIENKRDVSISILGQFNINSITNNYLFLAFQISNNLTFLLIPEIKPDDNSELQFLWDYVSKSSGVTGTLIKRWRFFYKTYIMSITVRMLTGCIFLKKTSRICLVQEYLK